MRIQENSIIFVLFSVFMVIEVVFVSIFVNYCCDLQRGIFTHVHAPLDTLHVAIMYHSAKMIMVQRRLQLLKVIQ